MKAGIQFMYDRNLYSVISKNTTRVENVPLVVNLIPSCEILARSRYLRYAFTKRP